MSENFTWDSLPTTLPIKELKSAFCFGDIHFILQVHLQDEVEVYKLARKIGHLLGHKQKILYVHRENRESLKKLGIDPEFDWLEKEDLPNIFRSWSYEKIQDYLAFNFQEDAI